MQEEEGKKRATILEGFEVAFYAQVDYTCLSKMGLAWSLNPCVRIT